MGIGTPSFFKLVHELAVTNVMIKEYEEKQLEKKIEKIVEKKLKEKKDEK